MNFSIIFWSVVFRNFIKNHNKNVGTIYAYVSCMLCRFHKRFLCILSILILISGPIFPSISFATPKIDESYSLSVVVYPKVDGTSDELSRDAAAALREALPHVTPMHIVSPQIVENVLSYYQKVDVEASSDKQVAKENLSRAKEHYFGFEYDIALAEVKKAIQILSAGNISENGTLLQDALLTQALISKASNNKDLARESLEKVANLNPNYQIDRLSYPPSIVELYLESHRKIQDKGRCSLRVKSDPAAAEVYLNGIIQGVTPLNLDQLPAGNYAMLMKTNKYESIEKTVAISKGEKVVINEKLRWLGNKKKAVENRKSNENAKAQIEEGIRIANLLKADKAILINCEEKKNKKIVFARMMDRKYQAGFRPLIVEYGPAEERADAIAKVAEALAAQAKADITKDPMKYLDKEGIGDPVLLSKRKKELHKKPLFWGAIGTVAAGALAGGLAAAFAFGSSPETGSLAIRFK